MKTIIPGDLVLLYDKRDDRRYFYQIPPNLVPNFKYNTTNGYLYVMEIVEKGYQSILTSSKGVEYAVLKPSMYEYILYGMKRHTQIIYPKDSAFIAFRMGIRQGARIAEIGTGSGSMTLVLSQFVGKSGHISTYEARPEFVELSRKNVLLFDRSLCERIVFKNRDVIAEGIDERELDNIFIDIREPQEVLPLVHSALAYGGSAGMVVATVNQLSMIIDAMNASGFREPEITELLIRDYKFVSERLRPKDSMVGHTAYIATAKKL